MEKGVKKKGKTEGKLGFSQKRGGPGGIRTLVQTGKPTGFYMLIPLLVFDHWPGRGTQTMAYHLNLNG